MTRRGFTLIETLASLVVLAMIIGLLSSWSTLMARLTTDESVALVARNRQSAIDAVVRLIDRDLTITDSNAPSPTTDGGDLIISTRNRLSQGLLGIVEHRYVATPSLAELWVEEIPAGRGDSSGLDRRLLLSGVEVRFEIIEATGPGAKRTLVITFSNENEPIVVRRAIP